MKYAASFPPYPTESGKVRKGKMIVSLPPPDRLYYFDTNALWKFYQDQPGDLNIRRLVSNVSTPILISPLTMLEFIGVLMKYFRQGYLKHKQVRAVTRRLRRDADPTRSNRPFKVVTIPENAFRSAEGALLQYGYQYNIQTNDSLHLAIVSRLNENDDVVLVTSDRSLQHTARREHISCYDPETGNLEQ